MTLTSILVNLLPIILVIGAWMFFMSRMKKAPYVEAQTRFWADYLEETRRTNSNLERIAAALEAQSAAEQR